MVRTEGPDGKLHDYEGKYTFGVESLQQYLTADSRVTTGNSSRPDRLQIFTNYLQIFVSRIHSMGTIVLALRVR